MCVRTFVACSGRRGGVGCRVASRLCAMSCVYLGCCCLCCRAHRGDGCSRWVCDPSGVKCVRRFAVPHGSIFDVLDQHVVCVGVVGVVVLVSGAWVDGCLLWNVVMHGVAIRVIGR